MVGCPEKHLVLKRAHATTTQTDSQIYDGDEVTITDPNCTVEIRIGNELRMLSSKETPYTARKAASTLIPRLLFAMGMGKEPPGKDTAKVLAKALLGTEPQKKSGSHPTVVERPDRSRDSSTPHCLARRAGSISNHSSECNRCFTTDHPGWCSGKLCHFR